MLAYVLSREKLSSYSPWLFMVGDKYFHWRTAQFVGPISWGYAAGFLAMAVLMTALSIKLIQHRDF
jgi:hypothetical protein